MTLEQLSLYIAIFAIALTAAEFKVVKNYFYSFLQNFVGVFFIVSGAVKIIDPLGTAYKMEEYFAEFERTFEATWFSFIAPIFPFLNEYSSTFSLIMIVFEIVLGVMLLIGFRHKLTAWLYVLLVIFFAFLTGFTYLTGYVPRTANFFDFGQWQTYQASNMRVTDCGCFGDFILLDPGVSFLKDIALLIPGLIFLFFTRQAHKLFKPRIRSLIIFLTIVATLIYGMSNYVWDLPDVDFRPFKEGVNVRAQMKAEAEAMANVKIKAFEVKNLETGEILEVPYQEYLSNFKAKYGKDKYKTVGQIKTEPAIAPTEISDFSIFGPSGNNIVHDFLADTSYTFMIVSYKLNGKVDYVEAEVLDTTYVQDTIFMINPTDPTDTMVHVVSGIDTVTAELKKVPNVVLDSDYEKAFAEVLNPILKEAKNDGYDVKAVLGGMSFPVMRDLRLETKGEYPVFQADGISLKTMIRSNPGLILWHDGTVVKKWHYKQVPSYKEIKELYIKEKK